MNKIFIEQLYDLSWHVTDDNYCGAPDSSDNLEGFGKTKYEALNNYMEEYESFYGKII